MDGHCTLTQPADEIGRVLPVKAKTQSCPVSCFEELKVDAVDEVHEAPECGALLTPFRLSSCSNPPVELGTLDCRRKAGS